jgi:hypothetical protein
VSRDLSDQKDNTHLLLTRLCSHVSETPSAISKDNIQTVCVDLQAILHCKPRNPSPCSCEKRAWLFHKATNYDQWNLDSNGYVQEVLRAIEADQNVKANGRVNGTCILKIVVTKANVLKVNPLLRWTYIPRTNRPQREHTAITSWLTPYGRVNAIISSMSDEASMSKEITTARLVVTPLTTTTPFCIEFEIKWQAYPNNCLNSINITYCAMRPNNSEVFRVASSGSVEELRQLLTNESARLTDRDTEGRSLLAVGKSLNSP